MRKPAPQRHRSPQGQSDCCQYPKQKSDVSHLIVLQTDPFNPQPLMDNIGMRHAYVRELAQLRWQIISVRFCHCTLNTHAAIYAVFALLL